MKKTAILIIVFFISMPFFSFAKAEEPAADSEQSQEQTDENKENYNYWDIIKYPTIRIFNLETFQIEEEFQPFGDSDVFNLSFDSGDINNDGIDEIIVGSGIGQEPWVYLFDYQGGFITKFLAYPEFLKMGIKVKAADYDKNGKAEILVIPEKGGAAQVRIFTGYGKLVNPGFFAFEPELRQGGNLAVADTDGDNWPEIIAGTGEEVAESAIRIFRDNQNFSEFKTDKNFRYGMNLDAFDITGNGKQEIIASAGLGQSSFLRFYNDQGTMVREIYAYHPAFWGGVNFDIADADSDGRKEIISGAGFSGGAHVRFLTFEGNEIIKTAFFAFDKFRGSVIPRVIDTPNGKKLAVATQYIPQSKYIDHYKMIEVSLDEQKLYTYYRSKLDEELLISSGRWGFDTPTGKYNITSKIKAGRMSWFYGPDNPNNYDLANVPNILPFYGAYTIHGAYWHNNFGNRMSHGCVNLSVPDSEWIYNWADLYIPVHIY